MMSPAEYADLMAEPPKLVESEIEALYLHLTKARDLEATVRNLPAQSLRDLNGWLARQGCMSGIPSLIQGLILVEAAERFMQMSKATTQKAADVEGGPVS